MTRKTVMVIVGMLVAVVAGVWQVTHREDPVRPVSEASVQLQTRRLPQPSVTPTPLDPGPEQASAASVPSGTPGVNTDFDGAPSASPAPLTPMPDWATAKPSITPARGRSTPLPKSGMPRGAAKWSAPDLSNPTAVGGAFCQVYFTQDATTDPSPWSAPARAARFATSQYAAALGRATSTAGDETWQAMREYQGYSQVSVAEAVVADAPDDAPGVVYRSYVVTVAGRGSGGWSDSVQHTQIVKLIRTSGSWAVDNSQVLS